MLQPTCPDPCFATRGLVPLGDGLADETLEAYPCGRCTPAGRVLVSAMPVSAGRKHRTSLTRRAFGVRNQTSLLNILTKASTADGAPTTSRPMSRMCRMLASYTHISTSCADRAHGDTPSWRPLKPPSKTTRTDNTRTALGRWADSRRPVSFARSQDQTDLRRRPGTPSRIRS